MKTNIPGIYQIRNLTDSKVYVGSAVNISARFSCHKHDLKLNKHRNTHLQRSWNKHGEDNFKFEILFICDRENLILFEQRTIDVLTKNHGKDFLYNLSPSAGSTIGVKFTEDVKIKIGLKSKGRNIGRKHTKEELEKMSLHNKGTNLGRIASEETRLKMSVSGKGRKFSEEHKRKLSISIQKYWDSIKENESIRGSKKL